MVEIFSVNPKGIRGYGNIVSTKSVDDFHEYQTNTTSGTDTLDGVSRTVYTSEYKVGSNLTITYPSLIGTSATSFNVTVTLKDSSNNPLQYQYVYLDVNGTVTRKATGTDGVVSAPFSVSTDGSSEYTLKAYFLGSSSISGCVIFGKVYVADPDNIDLLSDAPIIQDDETSHLIAILSDGDRRIPRQVIKFYEVWTPTYLTVSSTPQIFQSGDTATIKAVLKDEDGSRIKGETINFYKVTEDE